MFIKELKLSKVEGFKYRTEIEFKNEQNKLIDFYLENTDKIKEGEKYVYKFSDRIQINCILGKNGAGKTKLLSNIMHFFNRNKFDLENEKSIKFSHIEYEGNKRKIIVGEEIKFNDRDSINSKITDNSSVIYDDFFVGSDMLNDSIHEELLGDLYYGHGLNEFYCHVYNFLNKETHKGIFSEFLNLPNTYIFSLNLSLNGEDNEGYNNKNFILLLRFLNSFKSGERIESFSNIYDIFSNVEINTLYIICSNQIFRFLNESISLYENKLTFDDSKIVFYSLVNYFEIIHQVSSTSYFSTLSENGHARFRNKLESIKDKIKTYKNEIDETGFINTKNLFEELDISEDIKPFNTYNENLLNYLNFGLKDKELFLSKGILTKDEIGILSLNIFSIDLSFYEEQIQTDGAKKITQEKSFNHLSSGEKIMLIRFVNVYKKIIEENEKNGKKHFVILVDEPDLHLHLEWQQVYIQRLIDVFSTIGNDITMHFIIATHSPFIISDLPKENIIKLVKEDGKLTEVEEVTEETFGANYIDIIRNGFFDGVFLGNFSKEIIGKIADKRRKEITNDEKIIGDDLKVIEKIEKQIGDEFLRDNLLYFKPKKDDKNSSK